MLGVSEEYLHLIGLVIEEYKNLQKLDPEHPLLELVKLRNSRGFVKTDKFFEMYHLDDVVSYDPILGPHANYYRDLSSAQGKDGEEVLEKLCGVKSRFKKDKLVRINFS